MSGDSTLLTITGTSPSAASTAVIGNFVGGLAVYDSLQILYVVQGATGGTLDLYLQTSVDGQTWWDYAHFAQLAAGAASLTRYVSVSRYGQVTTPIAIGSGLTPALAAGTVLGGDFGTRIRLVGVAGAGTSAGAAQTIYIAATRTR